MDLIQTFWTASDEIIDRINASPIIGLKDYILCQVKKITKCDVDTYVDSHCNFYTKLYWKYDIDNAIFSYLQRNEKLSPEIYSNINKMRELLWESCYKYISPEELVDILDQVLLPKNNDMSI